MAKEAVIDSCRTSSGSRSWRDLRRGRSWQRAGIGRQGVFEAVEVVEARGEQRVLSVGRGMSEFEQKLWIAECAVAEVWIKREFPSGAAVNVLWSDAFRRSKQCWTVLEVALSFHDAPSSSGSAVYLSFEEVVKSLERIEK